VDETVILKGTPSQGLAGATFGFFTGFAAAALLGPNAHQLKSDLSLSPVMLGFAVAAPVLSGSLLRIPFSAWVDTSGGRRPFLTLLSVSMLGNYGLVLLFKSAAHGHLRAGSYPYSAAF
jgi:NNP family nitrate/nitrite transporter-like MFS transporter